MVRVSNKQNKLVIFYECYIAILRIKTEIVSFPNSIYKNEKTKPSHSQAQNLVHEINYTKTYLQRTAIGLNIICVYRLP